MAHIEQACLEQALTTMNVNEHSQLKMTPATGVPGQTRRHCAWNYDKLPFCNGPRLGMTGTNKAGATHKIITPPIASNSTEYL